MSAGAVILYDGTCGLCDRFVQFVLQRDRAALFRFATLQSAFAKTLLAARGIDGAEFDTIYVALDFGLPSERLLRKAKAVLHVLSRLGPGWRLLSRLGFLPAFLLDPFYDLLASVRYRLFGKHDACVLPSKERRSRFID